MAALLQRGVNEILGFSSSLTDLISLAQSEIIYRSITTIKPRFLMIDESIYSTLSDPYFAGLINPDIVDNKGDYERQIENYTGFLDRLEQQHAARLQDIARVEESINALNAEVNAYQEEIAAQGDELKQVCAVNDRYAKIHTLIKQKFNTPIEIVVKSDGDNNEENDRELSTRVTTTLNQSVEQLEKNQETLKKAVKDLEKEAQLDMSDFYDRLEDLNKITRILESFQQKYQEPRQASLAEHNEESSGSEDESQDDEESTNEDMQDENQESESDLMAA